ncbi:MAG: glycosyltransferase family 61 protein [Kordiimonadaceae bacterium]|nr:glycosyltransferase family 61 protein [Kordiimonadaceae bacterium]
MMQRKLKYGVFDNVAIGPRAAGGLIYSGGLANPKEYPVHCRHNRHGRPFNDAIEIDTSALPKLTSDDGKAFVYGGTYQYHFGHLTAEFIHRLWILQQPEFADCTALFIADPEKAYVLEYFPQLMDYLGVKKWKLITESCVVEKLVTAEQGKTLGRKSHRHYTAHLANLAAQKNLFEDKGTPKKIALLRGHMTSRRYLGEMHLANYLAEQGYEVYYPEKHPIEAQLRTIANASHIVISDGSICHLFDLLPKLQVHVAFLARRPKAKLAKVSIAPKVKQLHTFSNASPLIIPRMGNGKPQETKALLYADTHEIVAFLKKHGFVPADAPKITGVPFAEDIKHYLEGRGAGLGSSERLEDLSIELLAKQIHQLKSAKKGLGQRIRSIFL